MATTNSHDCRAPPKTGPFKGPVVPLSRALRRPRRRATARSSAPGSEPSQPTSRYWRSAAVSPQLAGRGLTPAAPAPPLADRLVAHVNAPAKGCAGLLSPGGPERLMTQTPRSASSAENEAAASVFGTGPDFAPAKMATRTCLQCRAERVGFLSWRTQQSRCRGLIG